MCRRVAASRNLGSEPPRGLRALGELHLSVKRHLSVNRSELVGLAIEVLAGLIHEDGSTVLDETVTDLRAFKKRLYEIIKS